MKHKLPFLLLCILSLLNSCQKQQRQSIQSFQTKDEVVSNGIYYWKTTFRLTDTDHDFLTRHHLNRLYLRLFDVDYDNDNDGHLCAVPIATTRFPDTASIGNLEIVPVVYITNEAIKRDANFATRLYQRIKAMVKRNHLGKTREIQLDCDWTFTTRTAYFALCSAVAQQAHKDSIRVSATIRLHQLNSAAPPVDAGVLMLYNMGSLYDANTKNSILNPDDAEPYLNKKIAYPLPLSYAYPSFSWSIQSSNNKFQRILHQTDFSDTSRYMRLSDNHYKVITGHLLEEQWLMAGDVIRVEQPTIEDILAVKEMVESHLSNAPVSNILYHLDAKNLSAFSSRDIDNILQ